VLIQTDYEKSDFENTVEIMNSASKTWIVQISKISSTFHYYGIIIVHILTSLAKHP